MTTTNKFWVIAGATLASVVATTAPAAAAVNVTVNGQQYNVEALPRDSFNNQQSLLTSQPWWGNNSLARSFAAAVGAGLGFPSAQFDRGPYFASAGPFANGTINVAWYNRITNSDGLSGANAEGNFSQFVYAAATPAELCCGVVRPTPVPVPLESDGWVILISTTALGLGVKLKQLKNKKKIDLEE